MIAAKVTRILQKVVSNRHSEARLSLHARPKPIASPLHVASSRRNLHLPQHVTIALVHSFVTFIGEVIPSKYQGGVAGDAEDHVSKLRQTVLRVG